MTMQRTTVRISKPLLKQAKKQALEEGRSFQGFFNDALGAYLEREMNTTQKKMTLLPGKEVKNMPEKISREWIYEKD